jgi:large subunit ribosomal protein L18e
MISGPENPVVQRLVVSFRKQSKAARQAVWDRIAQLLLKATRKKKGVNLSKLSRYAKEGGVLVVPAKVLSLGSYSSKATVYALSYSGEAKAKIGKAGAKALLLSDLLGSKVEPSKIRIII